MASLLISLSRFPTGTAISQIINGVAQLSEEDGVAFVHHVIHNSTLSKKLKPLTFQTLLTHLETLDDDKQAAMYVAMAKNLELLIESGQAGIDAINTLCEHASQLKKPGTVLSVLKNEIDALSLSDSDRSKIRLSEKFAS